MTFVELETFIFGGDSREFTYMMRCAVKHLYTTFYHKILGSSLSFWVQYIDKFWLAIYNRLTSAPRWWELMVHPEIHGPMDLTLESFRIFGFLDDVGLSMCQPGDSLRRRAGFLHDIQEAFFSGYFRDHGLKAQAVQVANGMFASIFVTSMSQNDLGALNMSGIDEYLQSLLQDKLIGIHFTALYVDGIFNPRHTIVPCYNGPLSENQRKFNKRLAGVRVSIKNGFALHSNLFRIFSKKRQLQLFNNGEHLHNLVVVSFLILNIYQTFNHSLSMFDLPLPSIQEYLPLDEVLPPMPFVANANLGKVYDYTVGGNLN